MDLDFWHNKWENSEIGFHQKTVHPVLAKEYNRFSPGKILVPLCGKTLDMLFLASKGYEVVGAELSSIACEAFFVENDLTFTKEKSRLFEVYKSERITLWCGDYFELPQSVFNGCVGIYDRAALVALPLDVRKKYIEFTLAQTANEKFLDFLLCTFEYNTPELKGPPFSVVTSEVESLFASMRITDITPDRENDFVANDKRLSGRGVVEKVYWISKN